MCRNIDLMIVEAFIRVEGTVDRRKLIARGFGEAKATRVLTDYKNKCGELVFDSSAKNYSVSPKTKYLFPSLTKEDLNRVLYAINTIFNLR